jgi:TonB family protein
MDAVSDILQARHAEDEGLARMASVSAGLHVVLLVAAALAPAGWLITLPDKTDENVMTISLAGTGGPRAGGMTAIGSRPVQELKPLASKRPEAVRAPAAVRPEMIEPTKAPPLKTPPPAVKNAPRDARSTTPTKGAEVRSGTAVAETGARGQGFGLTTGGGGGTGATLDVGNFCCPEYINTMIELIRRNWDSKQSVAGTAVMKFTIQRDGALTGIQIERSSGTAALDLLSQRALVLTKQLPPLPAPYPDPTLTVHLRFDYTR